MPPRRSCFPSDLGNRDRLLHRFQCHHGVPASKIGKQSYNGPDERFNATTAFLLLFFAFLIFAPMILFQCHHGVPASIFGRRVGAGLFQVSMPPRRSCFGAGAFKYQEVASVSMPPRRSCFQAGKLHVHKDRPVSMPPRRSCFARTGRFQRRWHPVSMPPRRSCFLGAR